MPSEHKDALDNPEEDLPSATITTPGSLDAWLIDDGVEPSAMNGRDDETGGLSPDDESEEDFDDEDCDDEDDEDDDDDDDDDDEDDDEDDDDDDDDDDDEDGDDDDDEDDDDEDDDDVPLMDGEEIELRTVEHPDSNPFDRDRISSGLQELIRLDERRTASTKARVCSRCGHVIAEGHRFCGACGTKYDSGYDFGPIDPDSGIAHKNTSSSEISGAKRRVERTSFVPLHNEVSSAGKARFVLNHIQDDGSVGDGIPLNEGENIIGRITTPVLSGDRFISPQHFKVTCQNDIAVIEDMNSLNGVFVRLLNSSSALQNGDVFRVGEELLSYNHGNSKQALLSTRAAENTEILGGEETEGWGYLRLILGAFSEGSVYRLSGSKVTIGRTHADILFGRDSYVSGTHASIKNNGDCAIITDLNSSNGTFIKIKSPINVISTVHILVGNKLLRIAAI